MSPDKCKKCDGAGVSEVKDGKWVLCDCTREYAYSVEPGNSV